MKNLIKLLPVVCLSLLVSCGSGNVSTTTDGETKLVNTVKFLEGTTCTPSETATLITKCEEVANPLLIEDGETVLIGGATFEMKNHGNDNFELWHIGGEVSRNHVYSVKVKTSIGVDGLSLVRETYDTLWRLANGELIGLDGTTIVRTTPTLELKETGEVVMKIGSSELLIETL